MKSIFPGGKSMNPLLRDMELFVEVAKHKSFTRAAESLEMYTSTLSKRIAALEKEMGVPLFLRNTRHVELTESGGILLDRCTQILAETDHAYETVVRNMTKPAGWLRLSMPGDTYRLLSDGVLSEFINKWPDIHLNVSIRESPADFMNEPVDVDIRPGPLADSPLRAKKFFAVDPGYYASPKLLEKYPIPEKPQDLLAMPCIALARWGFSWSFIRGKKKETILIRPAHILCNVFLCMDFALAGLGVAMLRNLVAEPEVKKGRLVRLLPEWKGPSHDVYMVTAAGEMPRRVRVFIDYMADFFAQTD